MRVYNLLPQQREAKLSTELFVPKPLYTTHLSLLPMVKRPSSAEEHTQKQILDIIVEQDDISWKTIIFGLIDNEQMDPWDINISLISQKFLEQLKKLKEMDFRISGKVVLASAILLKLKAERLRDEDLTALDNLMHSAEEPIDLGLDELNTAQEPWYTGEKPQLIPRTPQPRKRKVSVYDLIEALEKALNVDARRPPQDQTRTPDTIPPPVGHIDMSIIIKEVFERIYGHYERERSQDELFFHHLTKSADPRDIVMTFIPLLHLENAQKIEMQQQEHFGPIHVKLLDKKPEVHEEKKETAQEKTSKEKTPTHKKTTPSAKNQEKKNVKKKQ